MNINYGKQFIDQKDINEVTKCLKSNFLTQGPLVKKFEDKVAKYVGSKYAVAVSNGTAGLHISLMATGFKKDDKLLTSVISFVSSANVSQFLNGKVDFIDIDLDSISMNVDDLKKKIDSTVKAIMPVHMAGAAYNEKKIYEIARRKKIFLIEDCAHGLGGSYQDGAKIGSCKYSDMSVFSFHPVKSITTGEGGIVTTNSEKLYKKLLRLRSHGINKNDDKFLNNADAYTKNKINNWYYEMRELGYNYRLTDFQSALGISQLKKINTFIKQRRIISKKYDNEFSKIFGVKLPQYSKRKLTASHLYILRIDFLKYSTTRQELFEYLKKNKIICQVHYIPIVMHPYYIEKGFDLKNYPNAKRYYEECLSIPCHFSLKSSEQKKVIDLIKKFLFKIKKINVLLFGGSGFLGSNFLKYKPSKYNIFSYVNEKNINSKFSKNTRFKLNANKLTNFIKKENIGIIINAAGYVSLEKCEHNKKSAIKSNTKIVEIILKSIENTDIKFVYISTDHIFDKKKGKIKENEKLFSNNFYSKTKIFAENKIKKSRVNSLTIRSNFFGRGLPYRDSYTDFIIKSLKKSFLTPIWSNIKFTPVNVEFLVFAIYKLIEIDTNGIINISSNHEITKFNFALKIAKSKNLNSKFLVPKKYNSKEEKINRPLNMSLDNKKFINIFPSLKKDLNLSNQITKKNI